MRSYAELVRELEARKGLPAEKILEAMGESLRTACKRIFKDDENIRVRIDPARYMVGVVQVKEVVEDDEPIREPDFYIHLSEARKIDPEAKPGDFIDVEIDLSRFGLREAQVAKSKFREMVDRYALSLVENEFRSKIGEIVGGDLQRRQKGTVYVNLGKAEGILPVREQSPRDKFNPGDRIKCLVKDVRVGKRKEVQVILSRTDPRFVQKLFEQEIPEVYDKTIEIKAIAREPGKKTKVVVHTKKLNVDPVGACIGMKGVRIQSIVQELNGEMIDVVRWSDNPKVLIAGLLKPASVLYIALDEHEKKATVVVSEDQQPLAIGNKGINARLAARASGWNIDIKKENEYEEVRRQEEARLRAEEALGLRRPEPAPAPSGGQVIEEVEYEIDENYTLADLGLPETIQRKLERAGYDRIEKLIDVDEAELIEKAGLTIKQAEKVVKVMQEVVDVVEEEVTEESVGAAETEEVEEVEEAEETEQTEEAEEAEETEETEETEEAEETEETEEAEETEGGEDGSDEAGDEEPGRES